MPKAFTHLCKKINLSIFDDTLTVYPKSSTSQQPIVVRNEFDLFMAMLFIKMDCNRAQLSDFMITRQTELGVYRFVHRDDIGHDLYHQDNFSMDDPHIHAQFDKTIDETKLEDICALLEKYQFISSDEHKSFVKAFHDANLLPAVAKSVSVVTPTKAVTDSVPQTTQVTQESGSAAKVEAIKPKASEPTFAGLKPGFFNTKSAVDMGSQKPLAPVQKQADTRGYSQVPSTLNSQF